MPSCCIPTRLKFLFCIIFLWLLVTNHLMIYCKTMLRSLLLGLKKLAVRS
uniref:Uncharacterized protein n=1 Tax=Rhizophora mucronata TaxID=61149 RepID=A0A2P2QSU1_RHIMU